MTWLGLTPDEIAQRAQSSAATTLPPTLGRSLAQGVLGFGLTGSVVFAAVGCGRPWMFRAFGEVGPYLVAAVLFVLLGGGALGRLVIGPGGRGRFYALFSGVFFAYAAGWTAAYFVMGGILGELAGSLVGAPAAAIVVAWAFGARNELPRLVLWLTVASVAGYFLGRVPYAFVGGNVGQILFGTFFGALFGAGLGYALFVVQGPARELLRRDAPPAG